MTAAQAEDSPTHPPGWASVTGNNMAIGFPARFAASRTFDLQPDELVTVVQAALAQLGWPVEVRSDRSWCASIPLSGRSWGEKLKAEILPGGVLNAESKCAYAGQWLDFGKNRNNVETLFAFVEHSIKAGVHTQPVSEVKAAATASSQPVPASQQWPGRLFGGCLMATLILATLTYFISAVIGLLTGYLYLPGRGHSGVVHGLWARIISIIILAVFAWMLIWLARTSRQQR